MREARADVPSRESIFTGARAENADAHGVRTTDGPARQAVLDAPLPGWVSRQHRKPGASSFFGQEARRNAEAYRPLPDGKSLQRLAAAAPDSVYHGETASFRESITIGAGERYSEIMADAKICLAPRGSSVETYRFFEGMRQGCVVICNRLPPHWFYVGCPAIQIDDWGNLEAEVRALTADPQRLLDLHRETVAWWRTKLSEPAIGRLIAKCLESPGAIEESPA